MMRSNCIKKHAFSLLEVIIAALLFSMLAVVLFSTLRNIVVSNTYLVKLNKREEEVQFAFCRLSKMFFSTCKENKKKKDTKPIFYTLDTNKDGKPTSLVFAMNNQTDMDERLSGSIIVQIAKEGSNLYVYYWPMPRKNEEDPTCLKKELLLSGIQEMSFSFFYTKEKMRNQTNKITEKIEKDEPDDSKWQTYWPFEFRALPNLVCLHIDFINENSRKFYFFVKTDMPVISYRKNA